MSIVTSAAINLGKYKEKHHANKLKKEILEIIWREKKKNIRIFQV